jgi:hypothetical protein
VEYYTNKIHKNNAEQSIVIINLDNAYKIEFEKDITKVLPNNDNNNKNIKSTASLHKI